MVTSILPPKLIVASTATFVSNELNWTYDDGTGDPWLNQPYRAVYSFDVTNTSHSSHLVETTSSTRAFTGLDINIGDWFSNSVAGRAMRVVEILSQQESSITCILEDTARYNTFQNTAGTGFALLSNGPGIFFEVDENMVPLVHNLPNPLPTSIDIFNQEWAANITSRFINHFAKRGIYHEQYDHGFTKGDPLRIAQAADVSATVVDGTANPASTSAGDQAFINGTLITFTANATTADVVNEINSFNPGNGAVVASDNGGVLRLTATNGEDIILYDRGADTSLSSGCGITSGGNGVAEGQFIVADGADQAVAIVTEEGPDPHTFYFRWMGQPVDVETSIAGNVGDLLYFDAGAYTATPPANATHQYIKLNDIEPTVTLGRVGGTSPAGGGLYINKIGPAFPPGTPITVADMVTEINTGTFSAQYAAAGITAANVGGALQITNSTGNPIQIFDDVAGDFTTDFGLRTWTAGKEQSRVVLLFRGGGSASSGTGYFKDQVSVWNTDVSVPAAVPAVRDDIEYIRFANGDDIAIYSDVIMPDSLDASLDIVFTTVWRPVTTTVAPNDVVEVELAYQINGAGWVVLGTDNTSVTGTSTARQIATFTLPAATVATLNQGDVVSVRLTRLGGTGTDTYNGAGGVDFEAASLEQI